MLQKIKTYTFANWGYLLWGSLFFVVPSLGLPQLVTGIVVNALLAYGVLSFGYKKTFPLTIFPSLISVALGLLFGPFTIFLLYFVPVIILANNLYVIILNRYAKGNNIAKYILPSVVKSGVLFLAAYVFVKLGIVPGVFLTTMGLIQLVTATVGLLIGIVLAKTKK
ncbi:hypothetical protein JW962_01065 [Candidatus Dojkabacteria bacterium]|nr:hypothetical protein [Candidatus Dojkabacteria bacterium]